MPRSHQLAFTQVVQRHARCTPDSLVVEIEVRDTLYIAPEGITMLGCRM